MQKQADIKWFKIAESLEELSFSDSGLIEVEVNGKMICLALQKGLLSGCAAKCPHAGGKLAEGYIDALGNIVCPLHRYKFSLQTGRNSSGEGYYLKQYPIEMRSDGVFVGFKGNNIFG